MFKFQIANCGLPIAAACLFAGAALAQESASPTATPEELASPSPTPTTSASPTVTTRSVPLRFVPPPMDGTISLGIWDSNDKLVRVLHREAQIDKFTVEENSLSTTWDGKSDTGEDMPPGKYRARGYLVAKLKVEDVGKVASSPTTASDHISVKLVLNPLVADTRSIMEIAVAFDARGSFLKTTDGLPLATISESPSLTRIVAEKNGEKAADVWQDDGTNTDHLRITNIDKMMAFDCGFFQLK